MHGVPPKAGSTWAAKSHAEEVVDGEEVVYPKSRTKWDILSKLLRVDLGFSDLNDAQLTKILSAMEHPSIHAGDRAKQVGFQRLEWLGDSALHMCVSEILFEANPNDSESQLSRKRTLIVRENSLALWAKAVKLDMVVSVQFNAGLSDGMLCDSVEVLLGILLNLKGIEAVRIIARRIVDHSGANLPSPILNPKATLQDWAFSALGVVPLYQVIKQEGPDHKPSFTVKVCVGDSPKLVATAEGTTKQQAEESAALKLFKPHQPEMPTRMDLTMQNPKGQVQTRLSQLGLGSPEYVLLPETGPANSPFMVSITVKDLHTLVAHGPTRREAEMQAAFEMLSYLNKNFSPAKSEPFATPPPSAEIQSREEEIILRTPVMRASTNPFDSFIPDRSSPTSFDDTSSESGSNPKGRLQEYLQKKGQMPRYELVGRSGPDHAPNFIVQVKIDDQPFGFGSGQTKKRAEEVAAAEALEKLKLTASASPNASKIRDTDQISNPKGLLQERLVQSHAAVPIYEERPPNGVKFCFVVKVNGEECGYGEAFSKKEAQEVAARKALRNLYG